MLTKSKGNMYEWVTHMHSHLAGECPHKCSYCYVQTGMARLSGRYKGGLRLAEKEFLVNYGKGKTIFIEHMNDMFAVGVPELWQVKILSHCVLYPENKYIFQTKNPYRALNLIKYFPKDFIIGTTIETNKHFSAISKAPLPEERYLGIKRWRMEGVKVFVTIEPILDFDVDDLLMWLVQIKPEFINIGADSKGCGLPEPSKEKVLKLISSLQEHRIEIRKKVNLKRLGIDMEKYPHHIERRKG